MSIDYWRWLDMPVEIEKKFLISRETAIQLKENYPYEMIGIIQWYIDGAKEQLKSERIRLILEKDGTQSWIMGKKECINGDLVHRKEEESQIKKDDITFERLGQFPFIIKTRSVFNSPFKAEIVLDRLLDNPYVVYDVDHLLEVELENSQEDVDRSVDDVLNYFHLNDLNDISTNFDYTNNAIALRSKKLKEINAKDMAVLIDILEKEIRSDDFEYR